jgi:hypothetical protein
MSEDNTKGTPLGYNKHRVGGSEKITRVLIPTKDGNELLVFYNPEINLICIDLIDYEVDGGNEIFRKYLNEEELLEHLHDPG